MPDPAQPPVEPQPQFLARAILAARYLTRAAPDAMAATADAIGWTEADEARLKALAQGAGD